MRLLGGTLALVVLLFIVINVTVGGLATQYVFDTWGTALKHHPVHVSFFTSAVVGLFLGEFTIPAAVITWIVMLFY